MKGKFGKTGIICLALVLALATLGVTFAFWHDDLTIASMASTGYLQLKLTDISCTDNETDKDVGQIGCQKTGGGPEDDFTEFTLTVTNAYPGYVGTCSFNIKNTGTIPAYIYDVEFDDGIPYWAEIGYNQLLNLEGQMLNVNEWRPGSITVTIKQEDYAGNPCQENYTFDFTVTILSKQWNAP